MLSPPASACHGMEIRWDTSRGARACAADERLQLARREHGDPGGGDDVGQPRPERGREARLPGAACTL